MTDNLFDNAKFGDIFITTENKQAVFLRFAENAEYKFAILCVEGWGNVQVFRHNGKEIYNDVAHSIISKQEEPVSEDKMIISKVWFERCKKSWYNEGYIDGEHNRNRQFEEPVSEGLEEAADNCYFRNHAYARESFIEGAQWQKEKDKQTLNEEGVVVLPEEEFERMKRSLIKLAEREQQMMAKAIDGEVGYWNLRGLSVNVELPHSVEEGDKVKVIVIKED